MNFYNHYVGPFELLINYDLSLYFCHSAFYTNNYNTNNYNKKSRWTVQISESHNNFCAYKDYLEPLHTNEYDCLFNDRVFYRINYQSKVITVKCVSVYDFVNTFFNLPLQYLCIKEGMFLLHAMGIITKGKKVSLFVGESGVGKSSLLQHLINNYEFFCDDTVILQENNGDVFVWPTSNLIKMFLKNNTDLYPTNEKGKSIIALSQLNMFSLKCEPMRFSNVFYLKRGDEDDLDCIDKYYEKYALFYNNIYAIQNTSQKMQDSINVGLIRSAVKSSKHYSLTIKTSSSCNRYVNTDMLLKKILTE